MKILLLGAGGHARVVKEILELSGYKVAGLLDDNPELLGREIAGTKVLGKLETYTNYSFDKLIFGIGTNTIRHALRTGLFQSIEDETWLTAIHPNSIVSKSATIGAGTVLMAGAIINPDAQIGCQAIINTAATIDHDCVIDDFCHIAPGAHLAGGVTVGKVSFIGIGASVIPYRTIGKAVTVGAGATVLDDIADGLTVVGTPAHPIHKPQDG